ncbi:cyclophilin-like fold protein [Bacteroides sp. 51]|uniref:cyclophilin-like fold protein n=1 Tax=Bacteroides sp. 51 TaxID=2302938 RepID=UPI0013D42EEC|nr:cyclophilin-like fold protein [Bacteroides sp. 51]NDV84019.1 hypothetical protein [Bacteroides sp. 51]
MKRFLIIILSLILITGLSACDTDDIPTPEPPYRPENPGNNNEDDKPEENRKMKITTGTATFMATLQNNATATAFAKLLPITITMQELNNNEKYYDLPGSLPTSSSNPGTIQTGDLMLYASRTLVLFYKNFSTSYSYTRLGKINDPTGLASALGSENATITIELE